MRSLALVAVLMIPMLSHGQGLLRITEFMSEGQGLTGPGTGANRQREFFELTNVGSADLDVSAYSYNDNNVNDPHNFGAFFGTIAAGESIILTQMTAENFRTYWALPTSVRIFSYGQLSNLGNADTINIYNSAVQNSSTLVDSLVYTEDARGSGISRNRPFSAGQSQVPNSQWIASASGDIFGSRFAPNPVFPVGPEYVDLANPGVYAPVPEPGTLVASLLGLAMLKRNRR